MVKFYYFLENSTGIGNQESFKELIKIENRFAKEYDFLRWGAIEALLFTASFEQFVEYAISKNKLPGTLIERLSDESDRVIVEKIFKLEK